MEGKIHYNALLGVEILDTNETETCDAGSVYLKADDLCLVETKHGIDLGRVVPRAPCQICQAHEKGAIWRVLRKATPEDLTTYEQKGLNQIKARSFCLERVHERAIPLKLVRVHYFFDGTKAVFYYTAEGRIDFRELVKDLARELRMKIEMRQIGVRDEARMVKGYGPCGRMLCCGTFLRTFEPVTLSMAKKQNVGCNPSSLTGICGRLKCCLHYEIDDDDGPARLESEPSPPA